MVFLFFSRELVHFPLKKWKSLGKWCSQTALKRFWAGFSDLLENHARRCRAAMQMVRYSSVEKNQR
jgi:hypothetical protein